MNLYAFQKGRLTGHPWDKPGERIDPYLVWFDRTFVKEGDKLQKLRIDLLVELPERPEERQPALKWLNNAVASRWSGRLADEEGENHTVLSRGGIPQFVTGTIPVDQLPALVSKFQSKQGLDTRVVRFELAAARFVAEESVNSIPSKRVLSLYRAPLHSVDAVAKLGATEKQKQESDYMRLPKETPPKKPLLFVIDDFCNFAAWQCSRQLHTLWHQGMVVPEATQPRTPTSREKNPWEGQSAGPEPRPQDDPSGPPPTPADDESGDEQYGATLNLNPRHAGGELPHEREIEAYRIADYEYPPRQWSHGSAVMYAIANRRPSPRCADPDDSHLAQASCHIHFVQLPSRAVLDTSGGSLSGFALDGIHRAVRTAVRQKRPAVVVNLSYGTHSGPHDGTSMFERALKDLLTVYDGQDGRPALHVVLPAGNTHLFRCHANGTLAVRSEQAASGPRPVGVSQQHCRTLYWKVPPDDETDSFLEIWFGGDIGLTDPVTVTLVAPDGNTKRTVRRGEASEWTEDDVLRAALVYPQSPAQGLNGTMVLVALAPNVRRADFGEGDRYKGTTTSKDPRDGLKRVAMESPSGVWQVILENEGPTPIPFHAWVQRDDAAPGRQRSAKGYRGRQSYLLDPEAAGPVNPCFTLSGIATGWHPSWRLWVVGAMDETGALSRYSAAGPSRDGCGHTEGPDVVMTVDISRNQPGRLVGGVMAGSRVRLSGTSIGAAIFSRMLNHALTVGGPLWPIEWFPAPPPPPPAPPISGEPQLAPGLHRGAANELRLTHVHSLVLRSQNRDAYPLVSEACPRAVP